MLRDLHVGTVVPVRNIERAQRFYEDTLGLVGTPAPAGRRLEAGDGTILYLLESTDYPGQAAWPLASFRTGDLRAVTADLVARGVEPVRFGDGPQRTDGDGIADMGAFRIAWFTDPDGNIFSIFEPA
jgi:catechol 2,3-dioxygenase-like lactoylglutathione lyase family enzyme